MNVVRKTSSQKQSIALYELMFYGLLVRSGQLASILLALQFSQIFTNPGQIVFLLPIAIILIAFLGMLTLIEIECTRYMCNLDNRIQTIKAYLSLNLHQFPKNYLEKIVLPVLLNILSLPALLLFLGWTSTYLFLILMLSIAISSAVIFKFNYLVRSEFILNSNNYSNEIDSQLSSNTQTIPLHLLRYVDEAVNNQASNSIVAKPNALQSYHSSLRTKKRKLLGLIRQSTRIVIIIAAIILAVLNVTSIAKIAGFLIIGNFFRSGCTALFEFMSTTNKLLPTKDVISIMGYALIQGHEIEENLVQRSNQSSIDLQAFNQKYSNLIKEHPYVRFKNIIIKDNDSSVIAGNITSRLQLEPLTFIQFQNNGLANKIKQLLRKHKLKDVALRDQYIIGGDIVLGGQRLPSVFLDEIKINDPNTHVIFSVDIYDYFNKTEQTKLSTLFDQNYQLREFLDSIVNPNTGIEMHGARQINQFRLILQLIIIYMETPCISLLISGFEAFDPDDLNILTSIFKPLYAQHTITLLILTTSKMTSGNDFISYLYSTDRIAKK